MKEKTKETRQNLHVNAKCEIIDFRKVHLNNNLYILYMHWETKKYILTLRDNSWLEMHVKSVMWVDVKGELQDYEKEKVNFALYTRDQYVEEVPPGMSINSV